MIILLQCYGFFLLLMNRGEVSEWTVYISLPHNVHTQLNLLSINASLRLNVSLDLIAFQQ